MFDNIFSSSPNVWAGLITGAIAIPILIHLINLVRHKTVRWAAMEFLLKSHKRNRNYIWLKQVLLLLARIAILLLALMLLGQVGCDGDRISRLLGGRWTHHYVLLDDSFSMAQRGDNENAPTAFDRAKSTLSLIAGRAKDRQNQKFTLLRYSKVPLGEMASDEERDPIVKNQANGPTGDDSPWLADVENILVDSQFDTLLETVKGSLEVSWFNVGIDAALTRVKTLVDERTDENAIVYVLSDFRKKDWESAKQVADDLNAIAGSGNAGGAVELINCATAGTANVAIVDLQAMGNVRVAGAPLMMQLKVKNFGAEGVGKVQVAVSTTSFNQPNIPESLNARKEDLPTVFIAEIAPGETQIRNFPVFFETPGTHAVTAELGVDGLTVDNRRDCTIDLVASSKVLIVDDARQRHSNFLSLALSPDGSTGIDPIFATKDFLRDVTPEELQAFDVIFLMDVASLDDRAVKRMESFCRSGGGVAFFAGPKSEIGFYNRLYRQGQGIYPIELEQPVAVIEDQSAMTTDFQTDVHPIFAPVNRQKNTLLDLVDIETVIAPTRSWLLKKPDAAEIIASVRGDRKRPLFVTSRFGKGQVIACTTTAGPVWNNWARNATFPPIMLLMQDFLASGRQAKNDQLVQTPFVISVDRSAFLPKAQILKPFGYDQPREQSELKLASSQGGALTHQISGFATTHGADNFDVRRPGVYDVWLQRRSGDYLVIRKSFNVDVTESNLQQMTAATLVSRLDAAQPVFSQWNSFNPEPDIRQASSLTRFFLISLTLLLIAEQVLAYASSYHQS